MQCQYLTSIIWTSSINCSSLKVRRNYGVFCISLLQSPYRKELNLLNLFHKSMEDICVHLKFQYSIWVKFSLKHWQSLRTMQLIFLWSTQLVVMQFRKQTERLKTWFSKMSSCISFHISNSNAALYSRVSRGSGWFSGAQRGWMGGTCRCWPAPAHWYNNSRFLTGNVTFHSVQRKRVRFM